MLVAVVVTTVAVAAVGALAATRRPDPPALIPVRVRRRPRTRR